METYPLTVLEQRLKAHYLERPDMWDRLVDSRELSEYITWLAETEPAQTISPETVTPRNFTELAEQVNQRPEDPRTARSLSDLYARHREDRFVLAGADLMYGRMFRYMPAHWHTNDYFELYYCRSGTCPIYLDSETLPLHHGDVLILAPNVRHASPCYRDDAVLDYYGLRSSTFDRVFWNQLPADSLMSTFFRQALSQSKYPAYLQFDTAGDPALENVLDQINGEREHPESYAEQYLNLLMSLFFLKLFRGYEKTARLPRTDSFFWKHEFSAIFSFIQTHFADRTQTETAAEFGYSERQLNRIVKNCTGDTYAHLILKLRMERAALLLKNGADIASAAELCGYAALPSFYRAFTSYHQCTPAEYRKAHGKAD